MPLRHLTTSSLVVVVLFGLGVGGASAQAQRVDLTVRVEQPGALIRARANPKAEVLAPVPVDTLLVLLDRDNDWLWVLLPPDAHGTKRPGWIRASDVEKSATPEPGDVTIAPGPVKKQPKTAKPARQAKVAQAKPVKQVAELKPMKPIAELKLVKPVAQLKLVKPVFEATPRLDKARRNLEKAKQDYEKLTQATQATRADAPALAAAPQ